MPPIAPLVFSTAKAPATGPDLLVLRSESVEHARWSPEALANAVASVQQGNPTRAEREVVAWLTDEYLAKHLHHGVPSGLDDDQTHAAILQVELYGDAPPAIEALLVDVNARFAEHLCRRFYRFASSELVRQDLDTLCEAHSTGASHKRLRHFVVLSKHSDRAAQPNTGSSPSKASSSYLPTCPRCVARASIRSGSVQVPA